MDKGICIKRTPSASLHMSSNKLKREFGQAYEDLSDAIFRHCYFRLSDRERALDLMQETFMRVWNVLASGEREIENLKAFLYKTANNLVIDEYRSRKIQVSVEDMRELGLDIREDQAIEEEADIAMGAEKILGLLERVDGKYRDAVIMRYIDELSLKEIALITGEKVGNVAVRINRGLRQIREFLQNEKQI